MNINYIKWYFNINKWCPTKEQWLSLTASISDEEILRINKFVYKEDAKSSLVGQALIRKFLSHVLKIKSNEIQLIRTDLGRPKVCDIYRDRLKATNSWPNIIDFNISHSGDFCVLAGLWSFNSNNNNINSNQSPLRVGVDVTKIVRKKSKQELDRFLELMSRREFSPLEWDTVENVHDDIQKCINFTRLWCLKESFIKSIGLGLKFNLQRIQFQFSDNYKYTISTDLIKNKILDNTKVILDGKLALDWRFQETALDDEHLIAIGYNSSILESPSFQLDKNPFEEISIDSLIESLKPINNLDDQNWINFSNRSYKENYNK